MASTVHVQAAFARPRFVYDTHASLEVLLATKYALSPAPSAPDSPRPATVPDCQAQKGSSSDVFLATGASTFSGIKEDVQMSPMCVATALLPPSSMSLTEPLNAVMMQGRSRSLSPGPGRVSPMPSLDEDLEWVDEALHPLEASLLEIQGRSRSLSPGAGRVSPLPRSRRASKELLSPGPGRVSPLPRSRRASKELSLGPDADWWGEVASCTGKGATIVQREWWSGPIECAMQIAAAMALKGKCLSVDGA